jgi:N-acetylglucosaminyldiphosphoundecaprenol N-acetyl-beta-D-mannosaminyltransferase
MKTITIFALNLYSGGIEKYISILCQMLENDYKIEIITTYYQSEQLPFYFSKNIKIKYLTKDYLQRISIKKLLKEKKYFKIIKEIKRRVILAHKAKKSNIKEIKKLKSDYVITTREYHNKLVNKYLKNNKIIKIATEHNFHNNNQKYINKLIKSVTNFDYIIHCTEELYNFYKNKIKGPKNIMIPHSINIENQERSKLKNLQIISVGRISPEKGFLDLIDVMKEVTKINSQINLIICGDGQEAEKVREKIKENNLENNIKMLGFLSGKKLEEKYIESTIYIMPSISESFGLVLLEAMHFGLPCIAFDTASGAREILKNNTGILIKDRNKKEMAKEILSLITNKEKLKEYQNKGIKKAEDYTSKKIREKWLEILNSK